MGDIPLTDPKFRWTPEDNRIAEVELQMATILTEELKARPCVSLALAYESVKVRARVHPLLNGLEDELCRRLAAETHEHREPDGTRIVTVVIKNR
jgi:hypothetical protein